MKFLIFLVLILTPNVIQAQDEEGNPRVIHAILGAYVIAQFADVATTEYALGTGRFKEHNPLLKFATVGGNHPVKLAIIKGSITSVTTYFLLKYHKKHPILVSIIASSLTVITGWAAYSNSRLIHAKD